MEKRSDTESSEEILGDWDLTPPVDPEERVVMVSVPISPESDYARSDQPKEIETRVSDKEKASTSNVAGEAAAKRVLPPWMEPSYEWGGGKWKEDGRKKKKKDKEKQKEKEKEEIIPFKEIIEALLRNSEEDKQLVKKETRFTSQRSASEIMSKMEETAKPLGFNVRKDNYKVFEVAPSLHVVELRKTGGDTLEFHKFYKTFSSGLKDVVWNTDAAAEEQKQ